MSIITHFPVHSNDSCDLFRLRWGKKRSNTSQSKHKRYVIIILLLVLAALTFIVLLSYTSQWTSEDDLAFLDPMNNPNIRVGHG